MSKIFTLKIENRTAREDFWVTLQVRKNNEINSTEVGGKLPLPVELFRANQYWRSNSINQEFICRPLKPKERVTSVISKEQFLNLSKELKQSFNTWLDSEEFRPIKETLFKKLSDSEENRVLIQVEDFNLKSLPWHLWTIFDEYRNTEVALAPLTYSTVTPSNQSIARNKGRILAVMGNSQGINLEKDRQFILTNFSEADITFIEQLSRSTLTDYLCDEKGWDILFFSGHSSSKIEEDSINFYIDQSNNLTISEFKNALTKAIENGLKLAIFNSCDGLGLAQSLFSDVDFYIPQIIVMREPVPDLVAQKFLEYFLKAFSGGQSLYSSVRGARQKLESLEGQFPCASWLPVIIQNPAEVPPTWQDLHGVRVEKQRKNRMNKLKLALTGTALALISIFSIKIITEPLQIGDYLSEGEEILVKRSIPRLKQKGVNLVAECKEPRRNYLRIWNQEIRQKRINCFKTTSNYQEAFKLFKQSWQYESKDPETLIYLNNTLLESQEIEYYTIVVAVPILKNKDGSFKNADRAKEFLRGVAQIQTQFNREFFGNDELFQKFFEGNDPYRSDFDGDFVKENGSNRIGLKVVIADDSNIEQQARKVAKNISKQSDILGLIGHYASEMTLATIDTYEDKNLVLISPGTTTEELTEEPRKNFFRVLFTTGLEAEYLAQYLIDQGQDKAAVFYNPSSPFSSSLALEFQKRFKADGGKLLRVEEYDLSNPNFDVKKAMAQLQRTTGISIVLIPDGQVSNAVNNSIDLIKLNNGQNQIVGPWTLYSPKIIEIGEFQPLKNLIALAAWHRDLNQQFSQEGRTLWKGDINSRTALAYDAAHTLIKALELQDKPTRKGTQKILADRKVEFDGVTGKIQFCSNNGDRVNPPGIFVDVQKSNDKNGFKFVPLQDKEISQIEEKVRENYTSCDID